MDSSLRGYLATGDRFFLDEATRTTPALAFANTQMINLLEEPALRQNVLGLVLAQQRWRTEWADRVRQGPPPGGTEAFVLQGKAMAPENIVFEAGAILLLALAAVIIARTSKT